MKLKLELTSYISVIGSFSVVVLEVIVKVLKYSLVFISLTLVSNQLTDYMLLLLFRVF